MWDHLRKGIKNKDLVVKQLLRLSKLNTFDLSLVYVGVGLRNLFVDEAHVALDIFRFVVFFIFDVDYTLFSFIRTIL